MTSVVAPRVAPLLPQWVDLVALSKPRVTGLVVMTAVTGLVVAPGPVDVVRALGMLAATWLLVASANTLNCWLERDSDRCMARTAQRPLPAGRIRPDVALAWGLALMMVSLPALALASNVLTAVLGLIAHLSYVLAYTPLKRVSAWSTPVGCIPGAMPPLMGWTAMTGTLDVPAFMLFAFVALWQMPHTVAIGMFRRKEYEEAGLKVIPSEAGPVFSRGLIEITTLALVVLTLLFPVVGVVGTVYSVVAVALGAPLVVVVMRGPGRESLERWARKVFVLSMVHFAALLVLMAVDAR
ncbi:MAG: heme o synthase [Myxococcota bacterium]